MELYNYKLTENVICDSIYKTKEKFHKFTTQQLVQNFLPIIVYLECQSKWQFTVKPIKYTDSK